MNIKIKEKKNKITDITIEGDLVLSNCDQAKSSLLEVFAKYNSFHVTLEQVDSIDLSFVQLLISFFETVKNENKKLQITKKINTNINDILETTGFSIFIEKYTES